MRKLVVVLLMLGAYRGAQAQAPTPDAFAPLKFLVGSCWKGTFPDGKVTDEHCFEWVFDRKFIRDRHVVRGGDPYSGETLYYWDASAKRVAFQYFSSAGFVLSGTAEQTAEGIVFPQRNGDVEMKSIWTRAGNDGYRVWSGQKDGAGWKTLWTMDLTRQH